MIEMPADLQECKERLRGSVLESAQGFEVKVLDSAETAIFFSIRGLPIEPTWHVARDALSQTGRWPIVSTAWSSDSGSLADQLAEEEPFSRFFFDETPGGLDQSPTALIERSKTVDVDAFLASRAELYQDEDSQEYSDQLLDEAEAVIGRMPGYDELDQSLIYTPHMIDRAIFDHEVANNKFNPDAVYRWEWFEPDNAFLVLLPTTNSWETLAYMHWWGVQGSGSENYIALGNRWREKYGAELVCHYGTMLQALVSRPPSDAKSAWHLSREHCLASEYQLAVTGTEVRQYAAGLIDCDRWFLHDRP